MAAKFSPVSVPSMLHNAPGLNATTEDSSNWGGYEDDVTQANYFHTAEAIYTEPYGYTSSCGTGTSVAIWTGLGADSGDEGTSFGPSGHTDR